MNHWLHNTLEHVQLGEALIAGGVGGLVHGFKLCTGAERWHDALRQVQPSLNLADIFRARTVT